MRRARIIPVTAARLVVPLALALGAGVLAPLPGGSAARAAEEMAPLPPGRPKPPRSQQAARGGAESGSAAAPAVAVRPRQRAAPLPPAMPEELRAERDEEAGEAPASAEEPSAAPSGPQIAFAPTAPEADDASRSVIPLPAGPMPAACAALVADGVISAEPASGLLLKPGCAPDRPLRLSAIRLDDGSRVELRPAAVIQCGVVGQVARWVREDLAPAIAGLGTRLQVLKVAASYECRPRNRQAGAKISEHGSANALDVGGFEVADGRRLAVADLSLPFGFQETMKASACRLFTTVLGPGSDGYHEDHVHVDLARRTRDFRLCRWRLKGGPASAPATVSPAPDAPEGEAGNPQALEDASEASAAPLPPRRPRL